MPRAWATVSSSERSAACDAIRAALGLILGEGAVDHQVGSGCAIKARTETVAAVTAVAARVGTRTGIAPVAARHAVARKGAIRDSAQARTPDAATTPVST